MKGDMNMSKLINNSELNNNELNKVVEFPINNKNTINKFFGNNSFNDAVMRERLPKNIYKALRKTIDEGAPLEPEIAEVVANAMKDWAIEKGATHFAHWFQPMTGVTAEKHESFISPTHEGKVIMEFSGKELIKGEPDASSFPSGGLRATFEARGYTAWDCTSPAFLKEDNAGVTLCIPTVFCSYNGEALDEKTPLLRSMEALSKQAVRILRLFGNTKVKRIFATVGPEQEYFLIDKELFKKRKDLMYTGRTLFGAKPPKGQELEDHYFRSINERVSAFMRELNIELWKLGVSAKTQHNEVAPSQYELATIFTTANIANDHNQIIMEYLKKVADRHGLVCLLHEKPFSYINGSGKHNNWSIATDDGQNLLDPGSTPNENAQFLIFLCAFIKAVDEYPELLRVSVANPGNDHRLGANEAPPAIISLYLGEQLTNILEQLKNGSTAKCTNGHCYLEIGVSTLPPLPKDSTDRNRTSPIAFTGNKFEFRMVPSSGTIATPNTVLNTIMAESLEQIANRLEKAEDFSSEVKKIIKEIVEKHMRIVFNGNNYSEEWVEEAKRRGLPNIEAMVYAIPHIIAEKSKKLFEKHGVFSESELKARYEILLERYIKQIDIEAATMLNMAKTQILPASIKYSEKLSDAINKIKSVSLELDCSSIENILNKVVYNVRKLVDSIDKLEALMNESSALHNDKYKHACFSREKIFAAMNELRKYADTLETLVDKDLWPFPTYGELLYSI